MGSVFDLFASLNVDTSPYEAGLRNAESMGAKFGGGLEKAAKAMTAGITKAADVVGTLGTEFMKAAGDVAAFGDNIDKASQKLGVGAEFYQSWEAVLQHSGTSMDNMSMSFKTLAKASQDATNDQKAAFETLGMSLDEVSKLSSEELFTAVIGKLQDMEEGTERTNTALALLGKGAQELGPLLNTSAEDTQAMLDTVKRLGGVMSDEAVKASTAYQDSLQDLNTSIGGLKNNLVAEFLPAVTTAMDGLTAVFSGDMSGVDNFSIAVTAAVGKVSEALPQATSTGMDIMTALADGIVSNVPLISDSAIQVVGGIVSVISDNAGSITDSAANIITTFADGLGSAMPQLLPTAAGIVLDVTDTLINNAPAVVDAGFTLMTGAADGVLQAIPVIVDRIPTLIDSVYSAIYSSIPMIIDAGTELFLGIVEAIPPTVIAITDELPQIIDSIVGTFADNATAVMDAGITLLSAVVDSVPPAVIAIIEHIPQIVTSIADTLTDNIPLIIDTGFDLLVALIDAIPDAVIKIGEAIPTVTTAIIDAFMSVDWIGVGGAILSSIADGLGSGIPEVEGKLYEAAGKFKRKFNELLGIDEPLVNNVPVEIDFTSPDTLGNAPTIDYNTASQNAWAERMQEEGARYAEQQRQINANAAKTGSAIEKAGDTVAASTKKSSKKQKTALELAMDEMERASKSREITEAEYNAKRLDYLENMADKEDPKWAKYYDQVMKYYEKLSDTEEKEAAKTLEKRKKALDKLIDSYGKSVDFLSKQMSSYAEKLDDGFKNYYIWDKDEKTGELSVKYGSKMHEDYANLQKYYDEIQKFDKRGVGTDMLAQLANMSQEEGSALVTYWNSLTDAELKNLDANYKHITDMSNKISEAVYSRESEKITNGFLDSMKGFITENGGFQALGEEMFLEIVAGLEKAAAMGGALDSAVYSLFDGFEKGMGIDIGAMSGLYDGNSPKYTPALSCSADTRQAAIETAPALNSAAPGQSDSERVINICNTFEINGVQYQDFDELAGDIAKYLGKEIRRAKASYTN